VTPDSLLADLRTRGFDVGVTDGRLRVSPGSRLTPADRAAIRSHLPALVGLVGGLPRCARCGRPVDGKGRCWRCCDRACEGCGRGTGSPFLATCLVCDFAGGAGQPIGS
jgi:hypothetical protein